MDKKGNVLVLGLISCSPFANAEYLLRLRGDAFDFGREMDLQEEADLTFVRDRKEMAQGQILYVKGIVRGEDARPLKKAAVEIWQTNKFGQYHFPKLKANKEKGSFLFDANFRGWGRCITNDRGEFLLKTILPGEFIADSREIEPRQIHFRVKAEGRELMEARMFFSRGHDLTKNDRGNRPLREEGVVSFHRPTFNSPFEKNSYVVFFPLIMGKDQSWREASVPETIEPSCN